MAFVINDCTIFQCYFFNLFQVPNGAWRQFLKSVLHFNEAQLNIFVILSFFLLYVGILVYKNYFIQASWRNVYLVCMLLNGVFSALQLLLISGDTFGISPFIFALGDDVFADFISGIQFLVSIDFLNGCGYASTGLSFLILPEWTSLYG